MKTTLAPKYWILDGLLWDVLIFVLPGLVTLYFLPELLLANSDENYLWAFIITGLLDAGHVYTTIWRTWLDPEERKRYRGYYLVPITTFLIITIWILLRIPYLWTALAYFTIYHNYRQFYGFTKWYEKLNNRQCRFSGWMVQILCVTPFILFHFREGVAIGYMTDKDILVTPMPHLFSKLIWVYVMIVVIWILLELDLIFRQKIFEPNRVFSIAVPAILYGYGFLKGTTFTDVIYPLIVAHAISYFGTISLSLKRLNPQRYSFPKAFKVILITAIIFGTIDYICENLAIVPEANYLENPWSVTTAANISILLTPLICHYIFDSWIWRYTHPKAKVVFNLTVF